MCSVLDCVCVCVCISVCVCVFVFDFEYVLRSSWLNGVGQGVCEFACTSGLYVCACMCVR